MLFYRMQTKLWSLYSPKTKKKQKKKNKKQKQKTKKEKQNKLWSLFNASWQIAIYCSSNN